MASTLKVKTLLTTEASRKLIEDMVSINLMALVPIYFLPPLMKV